MKNEFETISFSISDKIGSLTINRPSKLNALNIQVLRELKSILMEIRSLDLRGLIFTGEGEKAFIAGADIAEMSPMQEGEALAFSRLGQQVTVAFESLPFPSIACVNGFALGGGFEMAMSCDFILASKNAMFGLPEVKLGLIPGFGGTQRLARIVGERRAKEIIFSGRNISAEEAKSLGIALEVYSDKSQLLSETLAWLENTKKNSRSAISQAKESLFKGSALKLENGLEMEADLFSRLFQTEEMKEGTTAFLEKRKAHFK